jgi:hypothetical protein
MGFRGAGQVTLLALRNPYRETPRRLYDWWLQAEEWEAH